MMQSIKKLFSHFLQMISCSSTRVLPRMVIRTGIGYDIHPLLVGRPLVLGGIRITHPQGKGLLGHSDADVLAHAIADALLGAAGKADIGVYFPNTDASIQNISSLLILEKVSEIIAAEGGVIINIDATLIAEEPKIGPYVDVMRSSIAGALKIPIAAVGLKATTNEGLGAIGRSEGIAALATASIEMQYLCR